MPSPHPRTHNLGPLHAHRSGVAQLGGQLRTDADAQALTQAPREQRDAAHAAGGRDSRLARKAEAVLRDQHDAQRRLALDLESPEERRERERAERTRAGREALLREASMSITRQMRHAALEKPCPVHAAPGELVLLRELQGAVRASDAGGDPMSEPTSAEEEPTSAEEALELEEEALELEERRREHLLMREVAMSLLVRQALAMGCLVHDAEPYELCDPDGGFCSGRLVAAERALYREMPA